MAIPSFSDSGAATPGKWNEELIFSVLTSQARRKLLVALATGGTQTGADLMHAGKARGQCSGRSIFLDSTLKNLKVMMKAGIVVRLENPQDRRRPLYALAPWIKVTINIHDTVIDLDVCVARLSADGN